MLLRRKLAMCGLVCGSVVTANTVVVIDRNTGRPISGAAVTLATDRESHEVETNRDGRGKLPALRPAVYLVTVEKPGYIDPADPGGTGRPYRLPADGTQLLIGLVRGVEISGQVTDQSGRAVSGMAVSAIRRVGTPAQARFVATAERDLTDDSGRYRLHHLPPGSYTVGILPATDETRSRFRGTVYYPGHTDPSRAEFVDLNAGDEISPIDVRAPLHSPGRIAGTISNVPGAWQGRRPVVAIAPVSGIGTPIAHTYPDSSGRFLVEDLPPGEYYVLAWGPTQSGDLSRPPEGADVRYASSSVSVRSDEETEANLALAPGIRVEARVPSGGRPVCQGTESLDLRSESEWPEGWTFQAAQTGDAIIWEKLPRGTYRLDMPRLERTCTFAGIRITGLSEPPRRVVTLGSASTLVAEVTVSSGSVRGKVTGGGQPAKGAAIGLLSAQDSVISILTQTDENGSFQFDPLPPGAYVLLPLHATGGKQDSAAWTAERHRKQFTLEHAQSIHIELNLDED